MTQYTGNADVAIPANARDIVVTVSAEHGGNGGGTNPGPPTTPLGGTGGLGRLGVFSFPNYVARTLKIRFDSLSGGAAGVGANTDRDLFDYTSYPSAAACSFSYSNCGGNLGCLANVNAVCCGSYNGCGQNNYVRVTDTGYNGGKGGAALAVIDGLTDTYAIIAGGGGGGGGGKVTYNWVYTFVPGTPGDPGEYDYNNEYWIRYPTEGTPDENVRSGPSPSYDYGSNGVDAGSFFAGSPVQLGYGGAGTNSADGGGGGGGGGGVVVVWNGGGVRTGAGGGVSIYNASVCSITQNTANRLSTAYVDISYTLANPSINSFTATTTVGSNNATLSWSTSNANSISINQGVGAVSGTSTTVNTGLQSAVGAPYGSSPATKIYTLTACFDTVCVTRDVTANVYNDQTPLDFTISNLSGREPNENIIVFDGTISGIDMPVQVSGIQGDCGFSVNYGSFVAGPVISNNQNLRIRTNALAFATFVGPVQEFGRVTGQTNTKTCQIQVGTVQKYFTVTTRAPDINETFDIADKINEWPFPKIDTTSNTPLSYIETPNTSVDDIDDAVEVKSNNPNVQVRINNGSWQNVRQS